MQRLDEFKWEDVAAQRRHGGGKRAVVVLGCILLAVFFFFTGWYAHWFSLSENARNLLWAIETATNGYYQPVDEEALYQHFFEVFALDPYSTYYSKEEYNAVLNANGGQGADTGISISPYENNGKIRIFRIGGNSPAERAGILDGMYIHRFGADGNSLQTGDQNELISFVGRHVGAFSLECGFAADGSDARIYTVASGEYALSECLYRDREGAVRFVSENASLVANDAAIGALNELPADTAYIRLDEFYGRAAAEFEACLKLMKARGRTNLILDLRCNGGGYLSVFSEIASFFSKNAEGSRLVAATARYRDGVEENFYSENRYDEFFTDSTRIFVLADEFSASASECLIGAMVSFGAVDYADIFVRKEGGVAKTYGKGIMQTSYVSPQGSALKLTTAEIFWPNGKSIHGVGVTEKDGAVGISATLLPGAEDGFLTQVINLIA
ncbi:MAG: hypothetical protein IKD43_02035 [Clostridia bacterium]|nr:hypothetical protein [Clostridia bacterium]